MKLLLIHANTFSYHTTQKTPIAEDVPDEMRQGRYDECLVAFTAVEKPDAVNPRLAAQMAADEIEKLKVEVGAPLIIVYPYAHLSSNLSQPSVAVDALKAIAEILKERGHNVARSPFGWYKGFNVDCKGHPLSELSKDIVIEKGKAAAKTREEVVAKIESDFIILTEDGKEFPLEGLDTANNPVLDKFPSLKAVVEFEHSKPEERQPPPSINLMRRLEWVDYEAASDSGHMRFYPKGQFVMKILEDWAEQIAIKRFKAMMIETPLMYDWSRPDIRGQGESFHERHYSISVPQSNKEFVLRFAGDFGLFSMLKNTRITYKQLPIRIYEFSKSFRYEKRGELVGLRRLRGFTMPDIHCFCADVNSGWDEYQLLHKAYSDLAEGTGVEYALAFRIVKNFYDKYKDNIIELLKYSKRPALIEILSEMKHYWAVKNEFHGVDAVNGTVQVATVQLDVEDAERYDLTYINEDDERKGLIICHSSIGALERWIYLLLEEAAKMDVPKIPTWISPVQVRLAPVNDSFNAYCFEVAERLHANNIRADVDDRSGTVGKKILMGEEEWIPYLLVVGKREQESGNLTVRVRGQKKQEQMSFDEFVKHVHTECEGRPFRELSLPVAVSMRPIFVG